MEHQDATQARNLWFPNVKETTDENELGGQGTIHLIG